MSALDRWLREGWLRPIDHALGASLQRLTPGTPDAVALAAALASRALAFGHSRVPLDRVGRSLRRNRADRAAVAARARANGERSCAQSPYVSDGGGDRGRAAGVRSGRDCAAPLSRLRSAARACAARVERARSSRRRMRRGCASGSRRCSRRSRRPPDEQALAAALAQIERVVLLTGGPGTGKTTTVARVLVLAVEAARAARRDACASRSRRRPARRRRDLPKRCAKVTSSLLADGRIDAALRRRIAERRRARCIACSAGGRIRCASATTRTNPLAADLVVVDEASMVDLPLMCKLVEARCQPSRG